MQIYNCISLRVLCIRLFIICFLLLLKIVYLLKTTLQVLITFPINSTYTLKMLDN
jgi:hypothetical protein